MPASGAVLDRTRERPVADVDGSRLDDARFDGAMAPCRCRPRRPRSPKMPASATKAILVHSRTWEILVIPTIRSAPHGAERALCGRFGHVSARMSPVAPQEPHAPHRKGGCRWLGAPGVPRGRTKLHAVVPSRPGSYLRKTLRYDRATSGTTARATLAGVRGKSLGAVLCRIEAMIIVVRVYQVVRRGLGPVA